MKEQDHVYGNYNPDTGYQYRQEDIEQMRKRQMEKDWQEYEEHKKQRGEK